MRIVSLVLAFALAGFAFVPVAEAHWDRSSTDSCPPNDIRWYFDHVHGNCCTPSWFCILFFDIGATQSAVVLP